MPIVRKLEDLERFTAKLLDVMNGKREIGVYTLEYEIAREFGFSKYIQKSVKDALVQFQLLRLEGVGRFKIMFGLEEKKAKPKTEAEKEKEIDEELDKYMRSQ
jgi:hypothetical protein